MKEVVEEGGLIRRKEIARLKFRKERENASASYGLSRRKDQKAKVTKQVTEKRKMLNHENA